MATVFISGGNRGIGLEFVRQYLNDGHSVLATCRNPESSNELQALDNGKLELFNLEVQDPTSFKALAQQLGERPIDIVIANAGVMGERNTFGAIDYHNWQTVLDVNTLGPMRLAECLIKNLAKGEAKKLVAITSKMGSIADNTSGGAYIYRSSKAALNAVFRSLAHDLKRSHNIAVTLLHPGWVLTDMGGPNALINTETSVSQMRQTIEDLSTHNSGRFLNYDAKEIPW